MNKRSISLTAIAVAIAGVRAFNNTGWKMDGDKLAVDAKGNPIYLDSNGGEMSVEGGTISRLNGEAKSYRERAEAAEATVKKYDGITDPAAAIKALDTVSKLDQKKLMEAGEVEKVHNEIKATFTGQLNEATKRGDELQAQLDSRIKSGDVRASKFVQERIAVPVEMFESVFASKFKVENGKTVPVGLDGNPIYSKKRAGELADIDEAFEIMVEGYAHKDTILKAAANPGSGNNGNGGNRGTGNKMSRATFDGLPPMEKANAGAAMAKGELSITD